MNFRIYVLCIDSKSRVMVAKIGLAGLSRSFYAFKAGSLDGWTSAWASWFVKLKLKTEAILSDALGQDVAQLASEEKRLLLSRLLARLAHEVRNPLSALDIHVQLLQEDLAQLDPQVRDRTGHRLEIIRGELSRLESIVEHFLRLTGPSSLELESVDLAKICEHVCRLVAPEAATRNIQLTMHLEDGLPPVMADAGQLTQALLNLVINALQAVEGGGRVTIRAGKTAGHGVTIEVGDSGPGLPEENRAAIFDPFYTTKKDGTGLGLWIAQQIVMAHKGTLQAANAPSGGALFTIQLPWSKPEPGK